MAAAHHLSANEKSRNAQNSSGNFAKLNKLLVYR